MPLLRHGRPACRAATKWSDVDAAVHCSGAARRGQVGCDIVRHRETFERVRCVAQSKRYPNHRNQPHPSRRSSRQATVASLILDMDTTLPTHCGGGLRPDRGATGALGRALGSGLALGQACDQTEVPRERSDGLSDGAACGC